MTEEHQHKRKRRKRRRSTRGFRTLLMSLAGVFGVLAVALGAAHFFQPHARLWRLSLVYALCGALLYVFHLTYYRIDRRRKRRYSKR